MTTTEKPTTDPVALRKALLEKARRGLLTPTAAPVPTIPRRPEGVGYPLSATQQRMWFLDQLQPGTAAYSIVSATRLTGDVNIAALEWGLNEVVRRHETLRATFESVEGEAVQHIASTLTLPLPIVDCTHAPDPDAAAHTAMTADAQRPFDLAIGPLLRVTLFRVDINNHILLIVMHHIISDGWSTGILSKELEIYYRAFLTGETNPLPDLTVQYSDIAYWQRQESNNKEVQAQLTYWQQQLGDAPDPLELPTDHPRLAESNYRGGRVHFVLPSAVVHTLKSTAQAENATPFMLLLAAFNILLSRYSRQQDITVGTPVAGRTRSESEPLIGLFLNTLVLRTNLTGNPTFRNLLARVRDTTLTAYSHQEVPFEDLVKALNVERNLSHNPLFQVLFVSQNAPAHTSHFPGVMLSPVPIWSGAEPFDLSCYLLERHEQIEGEFRYRADLFDAASIERIVHQFVTLLTAALATPDQPIDTLPLLTPAESVHLITQWNQTEADYPRIALPDLIRAQAERTPDAVALIAPTETLTYADLIQTTTRLAHALQQAGVKAGDVVGVSTDRNTNLAIGPLAILMAGAAYLPLDPAYPIERLAYMVETAGTTVVLTERTLPVRLDFEGTTPLYIDDLLADAATDTTPLPSVPAEALAYVIFTSGSTGKPKGVQINHLGLVNFLISMQQEPGFSIADCLVAVTSLSFDIAGLDLYLPLISGGRVHIASRAQAADGYQLKDILDSGTVSMLQATPATFRLLLEAGWSGTPRLKMLCGGEAMPPALATQLLARGSELWNVYGPTETTVWSAAQRIIDTDVAIGRPIANMQYYVLDEHLTPVPIGVPGELYIGGDGLAWGYRSRSDLTAERFVPDPLSGKTGARLYRTGDVVRYRPDGTLQFMGRVDHQVKVRGFRIELGEIEAALEQHPNNRQAVVLVQEEGGHPRLVAYVVMQNAMPTPADWRTHLRHHIPDYMIPAAYVVIDTMPLTPNGKVNRKALAAIQPTDTTAAPKETPYVPPRTDTERALVAIWQHVLGVEQVGVEDNFFDLGGHSLLAAQVIARITTQLHVQIPLRALFDTPTIAALAPSVEAGPLVHKVVPPRSEEHYLPLSYAQERLFFLEQLQPGNSAYHLPVLLRLTGPLDVTALHHALNALVARHDSLRTTFYSDNGVPRQAVAPTLTIPFTQQDAPHSTDAALVEDLSAFMESPFDIEQGPLLRATLIHVGDNDHLLGLVIHHLVLDGWSVGIVVRDLTTFYNAAHQGHTATLPPFTVRYADFAAWQRQHLQGEPLVSLSEFWRTALQAAPTVLNLPTDYPRLLTPSAEGATYRFALDGSLAAALHQLSRTAAASLYMTLLAAFQSVLHRYAQQDTVLVGTPVANRPLAQWENVVGLFINTLVMRADFDDNPDFLTLLKRVRDYSLAAFAHQDMPFERLVELMAPDRSLNQSPLFQVLFTFNNMPRERLRLDNLTIAQMPVQRQATQFDLALSVTEQQGTLQGEFEYNRALFTPETIARMAEHWETLLRTVVAAPTQPIREIALLTLDAYRASAQYRPVQISTPIQRHSYTPPHTPAEVTLERIWAEVLRRERVGIHDSFFDLGGDSILSLQIIARANRAGLGLSPHHIFEHQTIAELASVALPPPPPDPVTETPAATPYSGARLNQGQLNQVLKKLKGKS